MKTKFICLLSYSSAFLLLGSLSLPAIAADETTAVPAQAESQSAVTQAATASAQTEVQPTASSVPDKNIITKGLGLDPATLKLINQGQFKTAIEHLQSRAQAHEHPSREDAWLAFIYLYLNQAEDLKNLVDSSNAVNTQDNLNATLIRAFNFISQKKLDEAQKELQTISASAMSDAFVNFAFAALAGKQGKASEAVTYTERSIDLAPNFAWGYRTVGFLDQRLLNAPDKAIIAYDKALSIEPNTTEVVNALVSLKLARNDYDGAIAVIENAIKSTPKDADNYFRLAQIYMQQWRLKEAIVQLNKAIGLSTLAPQAAKYYHARASVYRYQGNNDAALADLQQAIDLSTDKTLALIELAGLEASMKKEDEATEHLLKAVELDPSNQQANVELVRLLTSRGKFDQLAIVLQNAVNQDPKDSLLRLYLGDALLAAGKKKEAIDQYKESANLNQSDPLPHRRIAELMVAEKNFHEAEKEYTRALNIDPNSVPDLVALGFCYAQTDDYLQAEAGFVTALALHQLTQPADSTVPPTRLDIIRSLCTLLFKEGRYADAAAQFTTVCAMDKSTPAVPLDNFMLAQAVALRDLSNTSFAALKADFNKLSQVDQAAQKINYVDTLLRGSRFDDALTLLDQNLPIPNSATESANASSTTNNNSTGNNNSSTTAEAKPNPFISICYSRAWLGKNELDKAAQAAQKAVDESAQTGAPLSDALCAQADVALAKGDLEAAKKTAQKAFDTNAKSFRAHVLLGKINMKANQPKLAAEDANKAIEIDPYFTDAYLLLGDAQVALGDLKAASASYQKAVNLYPGLVQTHESLVSVLKKLSLNNEANQEATVITQLKSQQ